MIEDLAAWGHQFAPVVFPLFYTHARRLYPVGTSFCFSRLGLIASALHCVKEALHSSDRFDHILRQELLPPVMSLGEIGLSVLQHVPKEHGNHEMNVWGLHGVNGNRLGDIVYGHLAVQERIPYPNVALSFTPPRIGADVRCVGFHAMKAGDDGIDFDAILRGELRFCDVYTHQIGIATGAVIAIFVQSYRSGFPENPCLLVDVPVENGMSGGPVFNADGNVCGIVSAGVYDPRSGKEAAVVSLLCPTLLTDVKLTVQFGQAVTMTHTQPLLQLIHSGSVRTDGSESSVDIVVDEATGDFSLGPAIHPDDFASVYDDAQAYCDDRPSIPYAGPGYRYTGRRPPSGERA